MAETSSNERTEAATPRHREEAREKGQVALSADISQACLLLSGLALLWFLSGSFAIALQGIVRHELLGLAYEDWSVSHTVRLFQSLAGHALEVLLPLLLILATVAVGVNVAQAGLRVSFEALSPKWERLAFQGNLNKLFSLRATMRGLMLLLKLSCGLSVAGWFLYGDRHRIAALGQQSLIRSVTDTWTLGLTVGLILGGMLLVIGTVDLLFQRWQHEQDLKMTRQEVRDEAKRDEGDPQIKARMKRVAREAIKLQMLRRVSEATVILTNPTHIAVALSYDRHTMAAPRVIAKGTGALAKRISRIANEHGIPVLERKPLARALYASVDIDQEIPSNLYRAIAEILAFVYGLRSSA